MSWLISLVVAGVLFASDGNLPVAANHNFSESKSAAVKNVKADETERFEQTYPLSAAGKVSVSNVNGSITIDVWDRNEVKLEYVKTADTKENLAEVEIKIDARQDSFSVKTNYGDWNRRSSGERRNSGKLQVEYHLTVPRSAVLDEIATVNGSIGVTGAGNSTKASAVNGRVKATNLSGAAHLSTVNGTVEADFDRLTAGSRISLDTVNGQANLILPSDADAIVKADTVNGSIVNDFGLPVRKGEYVGRDLYGKIGTGDVRIRLNSVNGGLSIKRKNDGKNLNPATNLLTTKNEENWNEDAENNSGARPPKPPRTPRPLINDSEINESINESLKEAQKEIAKLRPELGKIQQDALKQANAQINSAAMQARIKEAQAKSEEMMARLADVNWTGGAPSIEEKSESFAVKGTPKVTIEAGNFAVAVRGWDKSEVRYSAIRFSKNQNQTPLDLKATQEDGSNVNIKIAGDGAASKNFFYKPGRVRLEIFVPKKANLKIVTGGEIRLEGVSGDIDLQGRDETINVRDAEGKLSVGTNDGGIRVIGFRGAFDGKTGDGEMNLEGDFQSFNALAADGAIILTLPENADAVLEANTEIETDGLNLIRQNAREKKWRVGKGGTIYRMSVGGGKVIVRSANTMTAN